MPRRALPVSLGAADEERCRCFLSDTAALSGDTSAADGLTAADAGGENIKRADANAACRMGSRFMPLPPFKPLLLYREAVNSSRPLRHPPCAKTPIAVRARPRAT